MKSNTETRIEEILLRDYKPAGYNPRKDLTPEDPEYRKLENSIEEFGVLEPLVVNEQTGRIIGGHQRYKVLVEKGLEKTKAVVVSFSEEKEKAANLALNKITGRWDEEKLAILLQELSEMPDFNVGITGFGDVEISGLFDRYLSLADNEDDIDLAKEAESIIEPVTQKGDIIELRQHRIMCGDSSSLDDVKKLLGDKKASMSFNDPPYRVEYDDSQRPVGEKKNRKWDPIEADFMGQEEYEIWLKKVFTNMSHSLGKGAPVYIWNGHRQFGPMYMMLDELDFHIGCVITWVKERFALGYADYNQQSEFCLYAWKEGNGSHKWYGPANESSVWRIDRDMGKDYLHPTQKPVALPKRAIKNSSKRGDIVLDLFLGSGPTLLASEDLGRVCYGMEVAPKYCDVIVKRYLEKFGVNNVNDEIKEKYLTGRD